jgi:drug/metabolite transporter (DMT)-like permease
LGATGFFLNFLLDYQGLRLAPASHAVTLRISEAMLIVVLSGLILRERVGARAGLGLVAGLIGTGLVLDVDFKNLNLFAAGYRLGDLLILAGAAVEALYTVIGKRVLVSTRPLTATALACACGWLMLTMISLPQLPTLITHPPSTSAVLAAAYLGLFATSLGFAIWYRVLRRRESHRVGVTIMIQPVIGIPLAAIVFQESVKIGFLLGAALIALGVYLAMAKDMRREA